VQSWEEEDLQSSEQIATGSEVVVSIFMRISWEPGGAYHERRREFKDAFAVRSDCTSFMAKEGMMGTPPEAK
jgi:hypothetical protein